MLWTYFLVVFFIIVYDMIRAQSTDWYEEGLGFDVDDSFVNPVFWRRK